MNQKKLLVCAVLSMGNFLCTHAQDQVVKLTTSKGSGAALTLVVNRSAQNVRVDWGDGIPVAYEVANTPLQTLTGTVKGQTITLTSAGKLTTLICEGQELTALDVTGANSLQSLYCQNNRLTTLDVTRLSKLTDIDVSGNQISALTLSEAKNPLLENVNLANNGMRRLNNGGNFIIRTASLQHINVSGNNFTGIYVTSNVNLDALQCAGNKFTRLDLSRVGSLTTLVANDNKLSSVTMTSSTGLPELRQLILDNNELATLDVRQSSHLYDLSVSNNNMSNLVIPSIKLGSMNCGGNALSFRSLPVSRFQPATGYFAYTPQADLDITSRLKKADNGAYYVEQNVDGYSAQNNTKYILDLTDYRKDSGGANTVNFTFFSEDESGNITELEKASAAKRTLDYTASSGKFTFMTPKKKVYAVLTQRDYPGLNIKTTVFAVGKDQTTGVATIQTVTDASAVIYDLQGRRVATPEKGTLYIINGKKVLYNK